jgi:hypothetical protein
MGVGGIAELERSPHSLCAYEPSLRFFRRNERVERLQYAEGVELAALRDVAAILKDAAIADRRYYNNVT